MAKKTTPDGEGKGKLTARDKPQHEQEKKNGRPEFVVDWSMVDKLLSIQCTQEEVAVILGCNADTLGKACQRDHGILYREYSKGKRAVGKASLRHKQWQIAMAGNVRMNIFLGKNYLGQAENLEISGPGRGPIQTAAIDMSKLSDSALEEIIKAGDAAGGQDEGGQ